MMKSGACAAFLIVILFAGVRSSAQDMKPLSSTLAKSIAASGRKTVAVIDFTDLQGNVTELGRYLAEELSVDLVGDAKGYEVIERNQLKVILQEHRLSATGLIDPQTARKLGQIAGVDALVTGTITAFGDTVRLSAKVLDTQTAKMLGAATSDIPKTKAIEDLLQRGIGTAGAPKVSSDASSGGDSAQKPTAQSPLALKPTTLSAKASVGDYRIELMFTPKTCKRHRQELTCWVEVMNKGETGLEFQLFTQECSLLDDQGNQYKLDKVSIGQREYEHLEPEVPINIVAVADSVNDQASRMSLLLSFRTGWGNNFKTAVRNIPIEKQ
jgi:TolB-like protein